MIAAGIAVQRRKSRTRLLRFLWARPTGSNDHDAPGATDSAKSRLLLGNFRNQCGQVGDADVDAELTEQGGDLAAVMGLMIEDVA
jgi:hypothetical protein